MKHTNQPCAAIIGGGAAGLMAGCLLSCMDVKAVILEKQSRVGRKLLSTGNGRCNFTNLNASPINYHGSIHYLWSALNAFAPRDVLEFFEAIGVPAEVDEAGRAYPMSNQAAGVLDALRMYAAENGCEIRTEFEVCKIYRSDGRWQIEATNGEKRTADAVIVACGGLAAPKLGACGDGYKLLKSVGHTILPCVSAIAALKTDTEHLRALKGIRATCQITLESGGRILRNELGEVLFNETGLSGIVAMQMAREANLILRKRGGKCLVRLNFIPQMQKDFIDKRVRRLPRRPMEDFLCGVVPKRLGQVLMKVAGISPLSMTAQELTPEQRQDLMRVLSGWTLNVHGTQGFDSAQATCGGAALEEFDVGTLESELAPMLFAAGEVLDVDGDCGGFNLQWAWCSARLATREITRRFECGKY